MKGWKLRWKLLQCEGRGMRPARERPCFQDLGNMDVGRKP